MCVFLFLFLGRCNMNACNVEYTDSELSASTSGRFVKSCLCIGSVVCNGSSIFAYFCALCILVPDHTSVVAPSRYVHLFIVRLAMLWQPIVYTHIYIHVLFSIDMRENPDLVSAFFGFLSKLARGSPDILSGEPQLLTAVCNTALMAMHLPETVPAKAACTFIVCVSFPLFILFTY